MRKFSRSNIGIFLTLSALLLSGVWGAPFAYAQAQTGASLFLGPPSGTFVVGRTFSVSLYVNTGGQYINAIEAYLTFPPDKLQVVSPISEGKSFVELWASPPAYSNKDGTLTFQGAVHRPGINTESGVMTTITFRVKAVGAAAIKINNASRVFANDGAGTDILTKTSGALYTFVLPPPEGPFVTSPTHPDQNQWYGQNTAVFRWDVASDAEGYSYALSDNPVEEPDNISEGKRGSVSYENLPDEIHYFHIKSLRAGVWGGVTHYGIKIDAHPPANFNIEVSPSARTSQQRPVITFDTTDVVSGLDHYDVRIIRVDQASTSTDGDLKTPFFIEANSPYSELLPLGRYHVVVRAYDRAANYTQEITNLAITGTFLDVFSSDGIQLWGNVIIPWIVILALCIILLVLVVYLLRRVIVLRRDVAARIIAGVTKVPSIAEKISALTGKQKEYQNRTLPLKVLLALILGSALLIPHFTAAASPSSSLYNATTINPPIVTLFPQTISNDEILYVGGQTGAPNADVIITLQRIESGESYTYTIKTDKNGEWFYSFGQFLTPGSYELWTQLKVGEELSVPSAQLKLAVAPTALQIGQTRISFERLYGILLIIFLLGFLILLTLVAYHHRRLRNAKARLSEEIHEAEESVRRGFAVLRKDIQSELALVHHMKASRELSLEEKLQEEKLIKDLEWANAYIGKEVWDIEGVAHKLS